MAALPGPATLPPHGGMLDFGAGRAPVKCSRMISPVRCAAMDGRSSPGAGAPSIARSAALVQTSRSGSGPEISATGTGAPSTVARNAASGGASGDGRRRAWRRSPPAAGRPPRPRAGRPRPVRRRRSRSGAARTRSGPAGETVAPLPGPQPLARDARQLREARRAHVCPCVFTTPMPSDVASSGRLPARVHLARRPPKTRMGSIPKTGDGGQGTPQEGIRASHDGGRR